jgi:hypothetical protein
MSEWPVWVTESDEEYALRKATEFRLYSEAEIAAMSDEEFDEAMAKLDEFNAKLRAEIAQVKAKLRGMAKEHPEIQDLID